MSTVPTKVRERLAAGIKKFQPIVADKLKSDACEADTSVLVTAILCELFGYDMFSEIISEYKVKYTSCDKAIKLGEKVVLLIEIKAIGKQLNDPHLHHRDQAVDYAALDGTDWVVLTNAAHWQVYRMLWGKPVDFELVFQFNFCDLKARAEADIEMLSLLAKESWHKDRLDEYQTQKHALSRFSLAALILSDPILDVLRRELRRLSPGIKIDTEQIAEVLQAEVLKRDVIDDDKAAAARKLVAKAAGRMLRTNNAGKGDGGEGEDGAAENAPG